MVHVQGVLLFLPRLALAHGLILPLVVLFHFTYNFVYNDKFLFINTKKEIALNLTNGVFLLPSNLF